MKRGTVVLLVKLFVLLCPLVCSSEVGECVSELRVPTYPLLARQAQLSGTATVSVKIGPAGVVQEVSVSRIHQLFAQASREAIASSKFNANCAGEVVEFIYNFQLRELPGKYVESEIYFRPPNIFIIRTNRARLGGG